MFYEILKPFLKRMVYGVKKKAKVKVGLHCCGSVYALMDDLIDIGFDILKPLQSNAGDMGEAKVKEKAGRKLALWGGIDTHKTPSQGSLQEVPEEVKQKMSIYGKRGWVHYSVGTTIF